MTESVVDLERVSATLVARDYEEAITYAFIDERNNEAFAGSKSELVLSNPISSEMSVMRSSLLPGLVASAAANVARQQDRVRLFEIGKSFHGTLESPHEVVRIAAVASGSALPEQWGAKSQAIDFFDIKVDLVAVLKRHVPMFPERESALFILKAGLVCAATATPACLVRLLYESRWPIEGALAKGGVALLARVGLEIVIAGTASIAGGLIAIRLLRMEELSWVLDWFRRRHTSKRKPEGARRMGACE